MEEQGKRLLLAVAMAFALMFVWNYFFPPEPPPPPEDETAEKGDSPKKNDGGKGDVPSQEAKPELPEERVALSFEEFDAVFSSHGAILDSWRLKNKQFRDREKGTPLELLIRKDKSPKGALLVTFPDSTVEIPDRASWQVREKTKSSVEFAWAGEELLVTKKFEIVPKDYRVNLTVTVRNESASDKRKQGMRLTSFGFQDPDGDDGGGFAQQPQIWQTACLRGEEMEFFPVDELLEDGNRNFLEARWAGLAHSYFLVATAVDTGREPRRERISCSMLADGETRGGMRVELSLPTTTLGPGDSYSREFVAYLGPKFLDELEVLSESLSYKPHLEESVDLGFFAFLARPLLWMLKWFYGLVGSWGLAIILLTFTVKLATLYWTHKSMVSMQEMARLRPQLDRIKEKYGEDKQRQQVETMNLFKAHNVNPMASCLPMLLQMPIWFALYRSVTVAAELYHAPFITGWIDDLTAPDPLYILPVAVMGMMFLQSKLTPQTGSGSQQKMLQYGMPLMFGVFSFFFPAGMTLYIFTNTVLSAGHHFYMHKVRPKPAPIEVKPEPEPEPDQAKNQQKPRKKGKKRKKKS